MSVLWMFDQAGCFSARLSPFPKGDHPLLPYFDELEQAGFVSAWLETDAEEGERWLHMTLTERGHVARERAKRLLV